MQGCKHEDCLRASFDLLELLAEGTKDNSCFGNEQIEQLWTQFVSLANSDAEKDWFYLQLLRCREDPKTK